MPRITSSNSGYITNRELSFILGIKPWMIIRELRGANSFMGYTPELLNSRWYRWKKEDVPLIEERFKQAVNDGSFVVKKVAIMRAPKCVSDDCIVEVSTTAKIGTLRMTWADIKESWIDKFFHEGKIAEIVDELNKFGRWQCESSGETFYFYLV